RGEDGDAEVATGGRVEVGDGQGTTLGEEAEVTRPRDGRGQGGVEADLGVVVDQAEGVGPDDAHAVGAGQAQDLLLQAGPGLVDLGESRGDDEQGLHPGRGALADDVEDALRGYGDDRQLHSPVDVADRAHGADTEDVVRARVDRVDAAGEPAVDDLLE